MISNLNNKELETAKKIYSVFHQSYTVEAEVLGVENFPPLKRLLQSYMDSKTSFYGFYEETELAGVIEVEFKEDLTEINSLVVHPKFFRRSIASQLLEYIINVPDTDIFIVETGVDNTPAIEMYKKMGFNEVDKWHTDFGIRKVLFVKVIK